MKIGIYISPAHSVPPKDAHILAPWIIAKQLCDGLVNNGNDVYLFAATGSKTNARLMDNEIAPTISLQKEMSKKDYKKFVIGEERKLCKYMFDVARREKLDIVHIHQPIERLYPVLAGKPRDLPLAFTFHDPIGEARFEDLLQISKLPNTHFISLSNAQSVNTPLKFAAAVPNGIDTSIYYPKGLQSYLLIAGRIRREKGFLDAIQAAKITNEDLVITGEPFIQYKDARLYWKNVIKPEIDGKKIKFYGLETLKQMIGLYQESKAFVFPIHWEEPFGLVMIEAMACGTPVIAYNRGSVSEIVRDGLTGFIIDPDNEDRPGKGTWIIKKQGIEGLVEAIQRIGEISREACRKHVEENFTVEKMVEEYERVYKKILNKAS